MGGTLMRFIHVLNLNFPMDLVSSANEKAIIQAMLLDIMHAPYMLILLWNQISQMLTIVGLSYESFLYRRNPFLE